MFKFTDKLLIQSYQKSRQSKKRKRCIYVKNLPFFVTKDALVNHFNVFGTVKDVKLIHKQSRYTRTALVEMDSQVSAHKVLKEKLHIFDNKHAKVTRSSFETTPAEEKCVLIIYGLFNPIKYDEDRNVKNGENFFGHLEDAFHKFDYKEIYLFLDEECEEGEEGVYSGDARVVLLDCDLEEVSRVVDGLEQRFNCRVVEEIFTK